jgi:hypothetical protein
MPDAQKTISVRAPMKVPVLLIAVQPRAAYLAMYNAASVVAFKTTEFRLPNAAATTGS